MTASGLRFQRIVLLVLATTPTLATTLAMTLATPLATGVETEPLLLETRQPTGVRRRDKTSGRGKTSSSSKREVSAGAADDGDRVRGSRSASTLFEQMGMIRYGSRRLSPRDSCEKGGSTSSQDIKFQYHNLGSFFGETRVIASTLPYIGSFWMYVVMPSSTLKSTVSGHKKNGTASMIFPLLSVQSLCERQSRL